MAKKKDRDAELALSSAQIAAPTDFEKQVNNKFYPDAVLPNVHPQNAPNTQIVMTAPSADLSVEEPSFTQTERAAFRSFNTVSRMFDWVNRDHSLPRLGWEEGYDPYRSGVLEGIPEQYYGAILSAPNEKDALIVRQRVLNEMADKDIRARSGWLASTFTTLEATILDPTILFPVAATTKYGTFGAGFLVNAGRTAASLAPAIGFQNAILTGTKETEGLKDWAVDTLIETFVASAFGGLLGGFAARGAQKELKGANAFFKAAGADVDIKFKYNPDGTIPDAPFQAVAPYGGSVGAAEVESIQALLDEVPSVKFKDNKFIRKTFSWGAPIIEGLTSPFPVVRDFVNKLMPHNFATAAGVAENIAAPSARDFVKLWTASRESALLFEHEMWLAYLGIKSPAKA